MAANSHWTGRVANRSSSAVWVIWDEGDSDANKTWRGKPLAAGRRSPAGLDIDGVCALLDGMRIASLDWRGHVAVATKDWWWLVRGAEVDIKDGYAMQTIKVTSLVGKIKVVGDGEVSGWGPNWEMDIDASWGEAI